MRKNLLLFLSLFVTQIVWAQHVFNNDAGNGDRKYSDLNNWRLSSVVPASLPGSMEYAQLNGTPLLDNATTVGSIRSVVLSAGIDDDGGTITLTSGYVGNGINDAAIWHNMAEGVFTIDTKVEFASGTGHLILVNQANAVLTFGSNSELTLNGLTDIESATTSGRINMDGKLMAGLQNLRLQGDTYVTFGSTSDNSAFNKDIVIVGADATIEANNSDNSIFMPAGRKLQANQSGTLILNGANIYQGNITVGNSRALRLEVNKDQSSIVNTVLTGTGALTLAIGSEAKLISFTGTKTWNTGTFTIENFKNGVLKFGTDATGLTVGQLSQIAIGGGSVYLDADGYLIETGSPVYSGSSWSVAPGVSDNAVIADNYTAGSLEVNDLTIQSTATVDIAEGESLKVNGDLINHGTLNIASGGSLELLGSAIGNVTITRNTAGEDGYSIIGSPVTGATLDGLVAQGANLIYESDGTTFTPVTSGVMSPGKGYFMAQVGEASPSVSFTGALVSGDVSATVAASGYTLLANPYAAAMSVDQLIASDAGSVTTGSVYVWSDGGTNGVSESGKRDGAYLVSNQLTSSGIIGSVQGFFVQGQNGGDVIFTPSMQQSTGNTDASFYRNAAEDKQVLKLAIAGNGLYQETVVGFLGRGTLGRDYALDAEYLKGNDLISFYSKMEGARFATQGLPLVESDAIEVQLGMDLAEAGEYILSAEQFTGFSDNLSVTLVDQLTGESYEVDADFSMTFFTESVVDASRFKVVTAPASVLSVASLFDKISVFGGESDLTINYASDKLESVNIYSLDGRSVFAGKVAFNNNQTLVQVDLNRNQVYVLRVNDQSIKFIVK